jgi:predicted DNA binding CopG/RHH family protein
MSKPKLSKEEKEILKDFEAGEFESVHTPKRMKMLQAAAEEAFKKDKRINIRISSRDLESLQRRALEEGIPYQTLVSSVLHKYVSGGLHDIMANKALNADAKKHRAG